MGPVKGCGVAMQDGNQVDNGIVPGDGTGQRSLVVYIHLQHGHTRQILQVARVATAPRGQRNAQALVHQLFTNLGPDKASPTQHKN